MDSLIMDPFSNNQAAMGKMAAINGNRSNNLGGSPSPKGKPIGPVRPRVQSHQNQNNYRVNRNNNFNNGVNNNGPLPDQIDYIPANPNTAGRQNPDWASGRTEAQKSEDAWKASLRKRDPELQPTLPNLPARSRLDTKMLTSNNFIALLIYITQKKASARQELVTF